MASRTLDFSSLPKQVALPEGMYCFLIKNIQEKKSSNGNDMWLVTFEEDETKSVVFENYVFTENSMFKVAQLCEACGVDISAGPIEVDPTELIGIYVKGKVIQEEYEGDMKNRMKKVYSC